MRARITKLIAGLMAVSALAFGGASLASAGGKSAPVNPPVAVDSDTLQQGDQTTPDIGGAAEQSSESASSELAGESSSSSEIASNDGPGGHEDALGSASVDYQFQGEQ